MKIDNNLKKMGIFNNVNKFTNIDIGQYTKNVSEIIQANRGFETDKTREEDDGTLEYE